MDRKLFLSSEATPPPGTGCDLAFSFDLQRFDDQTISWYAYNSSEKKWSTLKTGTFAEFKADAESGTYSQIQLESNLTLEGDITANNTIISISKKEVTFDLAGKTLNLGNRYIYATSTAKLTIKDSTATTTPTVSDDYQTVTYTAGEIKSSSSPVVAQMNATVTLESGKITSTGNGGVACGSMGTKTDGVYSGGNSGNFVMNGGYIHAQEFGVLTLWESTATIKDGVIYTVDNGCIMDNGSPGGAGEKGSTINVEGGTLIANIVTTGYVSMVIYRANKGTLNVTGGKLVSTNGITVGARSGDVNISGDTEMIAQGDGSRTGKIGDAGVQITSGDGVVFDTSAGYPGLEGLNKVEISGGTINGATGASAVKLLSNDSTIDNAINVTGGTLNGDVTNTGGGKTAISGTAKVTGNVKNQGSGSTAISGGEVSGNVSNSGSGKTAISGTAAVTGDVSNTSGTTEISGGTVSGDVSNSNGGTVVVSGDDTKITGNVTSDGESSTTKIMGGTINGTVDNSLVAAGYLLENGKIIENPNNGWQQRDTTTTYDYVLVGSPNETLITATGVAESVEVKYDKTNKLLGVPGEYNWAGGTASIGYALAKHTTDGGAITITPETAGVKITGTGFFGSNSNIVTLTTSDASSRGIYVDATGNNLANITGGAGNDSIKAGDRATTLDGGTGNDTLEGNSKTNTFIYSAGNDEIVNYTHGTDTFSLTGSVTPPLDFTNANFDGINFKFNFGTDNNLKFQRASKVSFTKNGTVYTYKGHTGGGELDYIAVEGEGILLGANYGIRFDGTDEANENYETINAANVTSAINVTGNDKDNYIVAGTNGSTLDGGYGDDLLKGGNGADTFVYSAGTDSIQDYNAGDLVTLRGFRPTDATFIAGTSNISLDFGGSDKLVFEGVNNDLPISIQSGQNIYTYTKDYQALNGKSVTLAASFAGTSFAAGDYYTVDASAVTSAVSIAGNDNANLIIGSASATLYGGAGKDKLNVSERNNDAKFTFQYTAGKDIVLGFDANNDKLDITTEQIGKITDANSSNGKLAFTFGNKSDVLTFKSDGDIKAVSLQSDSNNAYLTKDGYVAGEAFSLFGSAKGKIDLTGDPYQAASITSVDATEVKKQSVTLTGGSQGGTFTFAENRKKDLFEYGGGSVTISGYEAGKDKINLGDFSIDGFKIAGGGVSLNVGGNTMSIAGAAGQEILIRQATGKSNSYSKMVFYQDGVLLNKGKRPTIATVSGGASGYQAENTIKKIYVTGGVSKIAVHAGNNKTTLDASDAGGVSLYGGAKNDKLIGSESGTDYFFYSAGKDVIENYATNEEISLTGSGLDLDDAKITVSKKSLKFKFSGSKNALTIKSNDTINSAIVDGETYTFSKNAIGKDKNVSLTSQFSGTYKISKDDVGKIEVVYGNAVKKNLTFKGSEEAETLTGGTKKTTFKGGGGADSLVGGSGKDIFFYAKGDKGSATIASFDFTKDKIKIANGTIGEISTVSGGIQFDMTSGKKGDTSNVGSFTLASSISGGDIDTSKVFIKANNNYYWFAQKDDSDYGVSVGDLITADRKVSKSNATATGFAIIDLGYSTNLTKSGVATKAGDFTFTQGSITKKTTET